jgi:predicted nucleic acid-binding protein
MPTSAEKFAVDTSVAVAAVDGGHAAHHACRQRVIDTHAALAGHAAFETYSVLTRMPGALRLDAPTAAHLLDTAFPERCWLDEAGAESLLRQCAPLGVVGGAIYDALAGQAAMAHGRTLLTRDRRAQRTYDLLGVRYELLT